MNTHDRDGSCRWDRRSSFVGRGSGVFHSSCRGRICRRRWGSFCRRRRPFIHFGAHLLTRRAYQYVATFRHGVLRSYIQDSLVLQWGYCVRSSERRWMPWVFFGSRQLGQLASLPHQSLPHATGRRILLRRLGALLFLLSYLDIPSH